MDRSTHNVTPADAPAAYARRHRRLTALLGCLEDALEAHARNADARPRDWGPAGDLGAAEPLIVRALGCLGGPDEATLTGALDAMEATGGD